MFHMHRHFDGPGHGRMFGRGDLKYVILELLKEQPRHGYEIIRVLEEQSQGFYSPSPGAVYPTLQLLEEMGYVVGEQQDGKTVYTITDDGLKFLVERGKRADEIRKHMAEWCNATNMTAVAATFHRYRELGHLLRRSCHKASAEQMERVQQIIAQAHQDIEGMLKG